MTDAINATKQMIKEQVDTNKILFNGIKFDEYQKFYFSTNENINGFMNQLNFNNTDKALCVLASSDQALNLATKNVLHIDTFDTNKLTFYFLSLKLAAIAHYNYQDYLNFISTITTTNLDNLTQIIYELTPLMDKESQKFWLEVISYNYKLQHNSNTNLNLFKLISMNFDTLDALIYKNNYLQNESSYNLLKEQLKVTTITFNPINCLNLSNLNNKYDFIYLSNILDYFYEYWGYYWNIDSLNNYIKELSTITNNDALIALNYLYTYYLSSTNHYNSYPIKNSKISLNDLSNQSIITFPHNNVSPNIHDGLLLTRIKK